MRRSLRFSENAAKVILREGLQFDADRQAALQFRQQVRWLGDVESARRDEQDVVGLHRAMLGGNRRAFDQRQQVTLHAFARNIGTGTFTAGTNLVHFVEKHDTVILNQNQWLPR